MLYSCTAIRLCHLAPYLHSQGTMETSVAKRKNGTEWIQSFVLSLDRKLCIACGRCYKSCPSDVMSLDEYEDDEDNAISFMTLVNDENCIGCQACGKVCPKNCFTYT